MRAKEREGLCPGGGKGDQEKLGLSLQGLLRKCKGGTNILQNWTFTKLLIFGLAFKTKKTHYLNCLRNLKRNEKESRKQLVKEVREIILSCTEA